MPRKRFKADSVEEAYYQLKRMKAKEQAFVRDINEINAKLRYIVPKQEEENARKLAEMHAEILTQEAKLESLRPRI